MYNQKMISFSKAFFIGLLIVGSTIANTSSDCVRDAAQHLSQEGQSKYSEISKENVLKTTLVANNGRRLQATVPTTTSENDEEDVFYEDGKKCAGQEVRTGKRYCKEYETLSDGSKVCKEYGELFEGSLCLAWGEEEVTTSVTTTETNTITNPLFAAKQEEARKAEEAYLRQKDVVDGILAEQAAQTKITREKLTNQWEEVEKEWIRQNTQDMQDAKDNLSDKQKQELRELKEKYDKGIEEITTKWETEIASAKDKQTTEITDVVIEYEKQTVFLKEQHDAEVQKIMDEYRKQTAELEAEFGEKFKNALKEWEAKWRNEQAADAESKRTNDIANLNETYEKKIEEVTTKYTNLWNEHHKGVQNAPVDLEDLNDKILQIKDEYKTWAANFNEIAPEQTKEVVRKCREEFEVTKMRITQEYNKMMDNIEKKHTVYNYEIITTTGQKAANCQAKLNSEFDVYRRDWELRRKQEIGKLNAQWEKVKATASKSQLTSSPISKARVAVKNSKIGVRVVSRSSRGCSRKLCGCHCKDCNCNHGSRRLCWYSPRVIRPQSKAVVSSVSRSPTQVKFSRPTVVKCIRHAPTPTKTTTTTKPTVIKCIRHCPRPTPVVPKPATPTPVTPKPATPKPEQSSTSTTQTVYQVENQWYNTHYMNLYREIVDKFAIELLTKEIDYENKKSDCMKIEMIKAEKDEKCLAEVKDKFEKEQAVITVQKTVVSKAVKGRRLKCGVRSVVSRQNQMNAWHKYLASRNNRNIRSKSNFRVWICTNELYRRGGRRYRRWCRWVTKPQPASPPTPPKDTPKEEPTPVAKPVELQKEDAKVAELQKKLLDLRTRNCVTIKYKPIVNRTSSVSTEMTIEKHNDIKRANDWKTTEIKKFDICDQVEKDEANKQNQILKDREEKYERELEELVQEQLEAKEDKADNDAWVKKHHEDKREELKKIEEWHTKAKTDLEKKDYTNKNLEKDLADAKEKWIQKYNEEHRPAHDRALIELDPTARIDDLKADFEKVIIKRNKTVTTLQEDNSSEIAEIIKNLEDNLAKDHENHKTTFDENQKNLLDQHAKELEDLLKEIGKVTASEKRTQYFETVEKEVKVVSDGFNQQLEIENKKLEELTNAFEKLIEELKNIPETIEKTSDKVQDQVETKKVCKEEIFGYDKLVKKYRCIPIDEIGVDVCTEHQVKDGKLECVTQETINAAQTCVKWETDDWGSVTCIKMSKAWPKYSCVTDIDFNGEKVCGKKVLFMPRFFCNKYTMLYGEKHCLEMTTFYGKDYHSFECIKNGEVVKHDLSTGTGSDAQTVDLSEQDCLEYKDIESETLKALDLQDFKETAGLGEESGRLLTQVNGPADRLKAMIGDFSPEDQLKLKECF